jgi:hypothetical protein
VHQANFSNLCRRQFHRVTCLLIAGRSDPFEVAEAIICAVLVFVIDLGKVIRVFEERSGDYSVKPAGNNNSAATEMGNNIPIRIGRWVQDAPRLGAVSSPYPPQAA